MRYLPAFAQAVILVALVLFPRVVNTASQADYESSRLQDTGPPDLMRRDDSSEPAQKIAPSRSGVPQKPSDPAQIEKPRKVPPRLPDSRRTNGADNTGPVQENAPTQSGVAQTPSLPDPPVEQRKVLPQDAVPESDVSKATPTPAGQKAERKGAATPVCNSRPGLAPEMVLIEAGYFMMGSPPGETGRFEDEGSQHGVTVVRPFAMSRCEVTVGEFRLFVLEVGYFTDAERGQGCFVWSSDKSDYTQVAGANWKAPGFAQTSDQPVACMSWNDVTAYTAWLSLRTGQRYRLPSEAEWEYVARAGTKTAYWWGEAIDQDQRVWANCDGCGSQWDNEQTAPVGSFPANAFAVHDTAGNVWEWQQDCWHENYQGAPEDGTAWEDAGGGDCARRVVRGGAWNDSPEYLRSAFRYRDTADEAFYFLGFRLARDL